MTDQDQFATVNGIEICYRHTGNNDGVPLLLVMGLGAQLIGWPEKFVDQLQQNGFWSFYLITETADCLPNLKGTLQMGLTFCSEQRWAKKSSLIIRFLIWRSML